jgi:hypothetical protein
MIERKRAEITVWQRDAQARLKERDQRRDRHGAKDQGKRDDKRQCRIGVAAPSDAARLAANGA